MFEKICEHQAGNPGLSGEVGKRKGGLGHGAPLGQPK
jgi:hypothetical protein